MLRQQNNGTYVVDNGKCVINPPTKYVRVDPLWDSSVDPIGKIEFFLHVDECQLPAGIENHGKWENSRQLVGTPQQLVICGGYSTSAESLEMFGAEFATISLCGMELVFHPTIS